MNNDINILKISIISQQNVFDNPRTEMNKTPGHASIS